MKANRVALIWIALTILLHLALWQREGWHGSPAPSAKFAVPPASRPVSDPAPIWREEFIEPQPVEPSLHVSSICELPGGELAAAWYAGPREGARDVVIHFATRAANSTNGWSHPRTLVSRASAASETFRFVRKVGNPLLFSAADGKVYLLYVSVGFGGWSSSSLNLKQSSDGGRNWSPSRRLGLSPFFNLSELVKNGPAPLAGGGWVVPIYHELLGKFPELLWLRPNAGGLDLIKTRAFGGRQTFQAALTPLDEHQALLFCRTAGVERKIQLARTSDGGRHWTEPQPLDLPNSNSGLDALRLSDGRLLVAFNDSAADRHVLRLAISQDQAATWKRIPAAIAEESGAEFSYPFLLQTSDGLVHLTYTWKRHGIKHVAFNLAWLDAQTGAPARREGSDSRRNAPAGMPALPGKPRL